MQNQFADYAIPLATAGFIDHTERACSCKFLSQSLSAHVRVALQTTECLMTGNGSHLHYVQPSLEKGANRFVI